MVDGDGGAEGRWATTGERSFSELNIAGMETEGRLRAQARSAS